MPAPCDRARFCHPNHQPHYPGRPQSGGFSRKKCLKSGAFLGVRRVRLAWSTVSIQRGRLFPGKNETASDVAEASRASGGGNGALLQPLHPLLIFEYFSFLVNGNSGIGVQLAVGGYLEEILVG